MRCPTLGKAGLKKENKGWSKEGEERLVLKKKKKVWSKEGEEDWSKKGEKRMV